MVVSTNMTFACTQGGIGTLQQPTTAAIEELDTHIGEL